MSRFLFYLILANMLTNMVSITPRILISGKENGTFISIILALVIGKTLTYFLVSLFSKFPGQGLPEIMKGYIPKSISAPILLFFSLAWYFAGLSTILVYTLIISRFLMPEMSIYTIVLSFVLVVTYGMFMTSSNILNMSEIVIIFVVPFIIFVQLKGYLSSNLNWDYVRIAVMQINQLPNYTSFTASLFIVLGTANLIIFNRFFTKLEKPSIKGMVLLTAISTFVLFTTYLLPIGFGGFDSLENVLYPWIATSDSIRMKYGIIDRIVFIFIGAFLAIGVISITMHWHISLQLLSSVIYFKRFKWKSMNLTLPMFTVCFWAVAMYTAKNITTNVIFESAQFFDRIFLPTVIILLFGCLLVAKKGAQSKCEKSKK